MVLGTRGPDIPPADIDLRIVLRSLEIQQREVAERLKRLEEIHQQVYTHRSNYGKSKAAPLKVALDLRGFGGRITLEVWVKSSDAADFLVEGSANGRDFRHLYTLSVPAGGGEKHDGYANAYPVIRVRTEAANDNEIEIVAAR